MPPQGGMFVIASCMCIFGNYFTQWSDFDNLYVGVKDMTKCGGTFHYDKQVIIYIFC